MKKPRKRRSEKPPKPEFPLMNLIATWLKARALRFQKRALKIREYSQDLAEELQKNAIYTVNQGGINRDPFYVV